MADPAHPSRRRPRLLHPRAWPVRWRLASVSAVLTFAILVVFALVVGRLVSDRLHSDFDDEVQDTANRLAFEIQVGGNPNPQSIVAGSAAVEVVTANGHVWNGLVTPGTPDLGPPRSEVRSVGTLRVASAPIRSNSPLLPALYAVYARSEHSLNATVNRLWLFLVCGVLGGTALAMLAGLTVAGRAMRPVKALTGAARKVAATRDPAATVPKPEAEDEISELARTLDQMLGELDAARSETEQMMHAQRDFVADASHELRTPLTSVLANLELLQERLAEEGGAGGEDGEIVESALRSSRRMSRLVSDLLLLAHADAGRAMPRRQCDLSAIASAAVSEVRPVADGHELALVAPGPVPLEGNPDELHRLVLNLLENGLRHTPSGTVLEVTVSSRNGHAVLEVTDDGPGLPAGMEEQVFARFVRGSGPADVSAGSGTGLGLAIVKAVATSHGGNVEAGRSAAGGARFTVLF